MVDVFVNAVRIQKSRHQIARSGTLPMADLRSISSVYITLSIQLTSGCPDTHGPEGMKSCILVPY